MKYTNKEYLLCGISFRIKFFIFGKFQYESSKKHLKKKDKINEEEERMEYK